MATAAKMAETKPRGDTDIVAIFILLCNGCEGVRVFVFDVTRSDTVGTRLLHDAVPGWPIVQ